MSALKKYRVVGCEIQTADKKYQPGEFIELSEKDVKGIKDFLEPIPEKTTANDKKNKPDGSGPVKK